MKVPLRWLCLALAFITPASCARKDKEKPDNDATRTLAKNALRRIRVDAGAPMASVDWARVDGGNTLEGLYLTSHQDAPQGLHLRLTLHDADGGVVGSGRSVALCVEGARAGERILVPMDATLTDENRALLETANTVTVSEVTLAGNCIRPYVHVDLLMRPMEAATDAGAP